MEECNGESKDILGMEIEVRTMEAECWKVNKVNAEYDNAE